MIAGTKKKIFWEAKIIDWETRRYSSAPSRWGLDVGSSVKARLNAARRILLPHVGGRSVLELGCGSARLMPEILSAGATRYTGIDFSESAIAVAKKRVQGRNEAGRVNLLAADLLEAELPKSDICFSLGLLDWLTDEETSQIFDRIEAPYHLHSFSERRRFSPERLIHRAYVFLSYGRREHYAPRYHHENEILERLGRRSDSPVRITRERAMRFGAVASNLENAG